jgi:hypothetical protein
MRAINLHTSRVFWTAHSLALPVVAATHAIAEVFERAPFAFTQLLTFQIYSCLKVAILVCVYKEGGVLGVMGRWKLWGKYICAAN